MAGENGEWLRQMRKLKITMASEIIESLLREKYIMKVKLSVVENGCINMSNGY